MKHSQRASSEFGEPAGNSGEIRIRRWTQSLRWRGLVIPISCIGAYDGKQARREGPARLLQGSDGHKNDFSVRSITPANYDRPPAVDGTPLFAAIFTLVFCFLPLASNTAAHCA